MVVPPWFKGFVVKAILPTSLLAAAIIRPSFLSIGYVVLALLSAVLPPIRPNYPLPKAVGSFVTLTLLYAIPVALAVGGYQISEVVSHKNETTYICNRADTQLFRNIGLVRFHPDGSFDSLRAFLPEIIVLTTSVLVFIIVMLLSHRNEHLDVVGDENSQNVVNVRNGAGNGNQAKTQTSLLFRAVLNSLRRLTNFIIFLFTAYVGVIRPSATNFVYFAAFLFISTWWATYQPLRHHIYNKIKKFLIFYSACHFIAIYTYQIPLVHAWIPARSFIARLFGLNVLMHSECPDWWKFPFIAPDFDNTDLMMKWPLYANPIVVLCFYYLTIAQFKFTRDGSRQYIDDNDFGSSVHEELLSNGSENQLQPGEPQRDRSVSPVRQRGENNENSIPLRKVTSQVVDRNKLSHIFNVPGESESATSKGMIAVITFVIYHSYSIALTAMMTWALLYHSIFGLILLITTCILWIFKDTRKTSFAVAPLLLLYVEFLLCFQYLLSMDVHKELGDPKWITFFGIAWATLPVHATMILMVQTLLSLPVFLLLRLARREKYYESLTDFERQRRINSYGTFGASKTGSGGVAVAKDPKSRKFANFVEYLSNKVAVYFVFLVALVLLIVATYFKPTFYTIGFFCIWSLLVLYLKISFRLFRGVAYVFWLSLTFYTSLVIIALYIYQFRGISTWLQQTTGWSKEWFDAIGLQDFAAIGEAGRLFLALLAPIALFVVTMLQLKFFHGPWLRATSRQTPTEAEQQQQQRALEEQGPSTGGDTLAKKLHKLANDTVELLWRFFEVHISKIVFIIIAIFVANNINALYIPLVILLSLAICLPSAADGIFSILMCTYLFLVAIVKMVYQLDVIPRLGEIKRDVGDPNCTTNVSVAKWIGLKKENEQAPIYMLWGVIIAVIAMAFQSIVVYRQRYFRSLRGLPESLRARVFPDFHHSNYDRSMKHAWMFIIDYGFYKFGLEICIVAMGIDAWVRMDTLGAIQCFWIVLFAMNRRPFVRRMWPVYLVYMSILYPLQFMIYVGLPPDSCIEYPWTNILKSYSKQANHNLAVLLDLPTYEQQWPVAFLIADFFVLLLAACQLNVFRREGEDNDSIYSDGYYIIKSAENPHYDFIDTKKSAVDYLKTLIYHYGHWITLVATLAAGIAGTSLFALGYIILTLWLLWQGNNLYVMNARARSFQTTLKRWNLILAYTLFTITMKVLLQMFGCVFLKMFDRTGHSFEKIACIARQLFSITCIYNYGVTEPLPGLQEFEKTCAVDAKEAKIGYDIVALAFVIMQIRIFHSWYFQHCMVEYRSEVILANRGAVLKNQLIEKEMKEQNEQQKAKFNDIRRRTEAIRERYHKQQERGAEKVFEPKTYGQAKRGGDYYMFEEDPEADDLVEPVESFVPEVDPKATEYNRLDPGQIMYAATAHDMDLAKTLGQVKKGDAIRDADDRALVAVSQPPPHAERKAGGAEAASPDDEDESKVEAAVKFGQKMLSSALDMCSVMLNKLCREHRYVGYVLSKEKQKLKAGHADSLSNTSRKLTELRTDVDLTSLQLVQSECDVDKMETEAVSDWQQKSSTMRFVNAIVNCIGAHTDILCYFFSIMTQVMTGGLLTMPLPLMALFWGNLSNPRPSKFFWVTMITYTEFVIVVKFICQFSFFTFNTTEYISKNQQEALSPDKVFGISKRDYFALWDIILLFALFFHRYMLRKLGLWKDANLTDTFLAPPRITTGSDSEPTSTQKEQQQQQQKDLEANSTQKESPAIVVEPTQKESATTTTEKTQATQKDHVSTSSEITIYSADTVPPAELAATAAADAQNATPTLGPIGRFIAQLFHPKFRYIRDLYPIMFGIDVLCFLIMTIGYSSFGDGGSGNVLDDVKASRIPLNLVVMLIGMTLAIIVDRALYLRKSVGGKLIYQIVMISFVHVWMFFILPQMTGRAAITNKVAMALYVIKSCYFLVSAWQIRNGYPELCIGNLLTHSYGMTNMIAFKVFMNIPFLFELRTAIDWTWTDTSMPLFDFFNMENFYAHIFNLKCARQFEAAYPAPRGIPKGKLVKYMMGFPFIIGVVLFVWSPLLLFSLLNQIGTISMPEKVQLTVSIEGYPPLFEMEAQGRAVDNPELQTMSAAQYKTLTDVATGRYSVGNSDSIQRSRMTVSYLKGYTPDDILIARFRPESDVYWPISQDSIDAMINKLEGNTSANFEVVLSFTRPYDPNENTALTHKRSWLIPIDESKAARQEIIEALKGNTSQVISIKTALPSYIQVPNSGELSLPTPLGNSIVLDASSGAYDPNMSYSQRTTAWFDTLNMALHSGSSGTNSRIWIVSQQHPGAPNDQMFLAAENTPYGAHRPYVEVIGFVDRAFPSILAKIYKGGVIAMYLSVVIVVGRGIVRGIFTTSPSSVMFNELPNADHLLKICLDIYLVREAKDFFLEQDLFAKLIFLFRSPATLIEWTRMSKKKLE